MDSSDNRRSVLEKINLIVNDALINFKALNSLKRQ